MSSNKQQDAMGDGSDPSDKTQLDREKAMEELFGTKVILGQLQLKKPLLRHELDDGLTDAQRSAEQAKERRLAIAAAREKSYRESIQQFNEKLSKLTDHNEMPRISGS
jgi:hypothetical protein